MTHFQIKQLKLPQLPLSIIGLMGMMATIFTTSLHAQVFYVSPTGKDNNAGSQKLPFRTIQKAHDVANPGDTIYLRKGVYYVDGYNNGRGVWITRSGTPGNPIRLWAYPGELPIIDGSRWTAAGERYLIQTSANWWHIRGLELRNLPMTPVYLSYIGLTCWDCNDNIFELLNIHHIQGTGLTVGNYSNRNLVVNVDSHHNYDPITLGGNADGIGITYLQPGTSGNVVRGCRSWWNSDDGIDLWQSESSVLVENNWSFRNGYLPGTSTPAALGNGFKLGESFQSPVHVIRNNLAFSNRIYGFDENVASGGQRWLNNTAYQNGNAGFRIVNVLPYELRNNLAVPNTVNIPSGVATPSNSWSLPVTADAADFQSTSLSGVDGARQPDGSLPVLTFLKLRPDSDLINKGVNVGLPFLGLAPDLGAYEKQ